jgi:hypothetical protein
MHPQRTAIEQALGDAIPLRTIVVCFQNGVDSPQTGTSAHEAHAIARNRLVGAMSPSKLCAFTVGDALPNAHKMA